MVAPWSVSLQILRSCVLTAGVVGGITSSLWFLSAMLVMFFGASVSILLDLSPVGPLELPQQTLTSF